jgi:hypothetical protein
MSADADLTLLICIHSITSKQYIGSFIHLGRLSRLEVYKL